MLRALRHALIACLTLLVSLALVNLVRALGMLELLVLVFFFLFFPFLGAPKVGHAHCLLHSAGITCFFSSIFALGTGVALLFCVCVGGARG